jgi:hypothetical protein
VEGIPPNGQECDAADHSIPRGNEDSTGVEEAIKGLPHSNPLSGPRTLARGWILLHPVKNGWNHRNLEQPALKATLAQAS